MAKKKKWVQAATEHAHGQFAAKARKAGETTKEFASEHAGSPGKLGKQARLAQTLMSMHPSSPKASRRAILYKKD